MTALLILMLVGQTIWYPSAGGVIFPKGWSPSPGIQGVYPILSPPPPQLTEQDIDNRITTLLTEYADECYADSTTRYTILSCDSAMYWEQIKLPDAKRNYLFRIVHKQPTFPDFINWLKRRTP
jgi:hypothetical protein